MIQIINYGAGNIGSVINALNKIGEKYEIISSPKEIRKDSKIIFPGVGAAGAAMKNLQKTGFASAIGKIKNPFLGICLGMQLMFSYSEENKTKCLKLIDGKVQKFSDGLKVPQIGWNKVFQTVKNPLFKGIPKGSYFYFVNSYYAPNEGSYVIGETLYGISFSSAVRRKNFYGVQFHPEKSGETGLKLLNNFCKLC